jgi:hypothetical protein
MGVTGESDRAAVAPGCCWMGDALESEERLACYGNRIYSRVQYPRIPSGFAIYRRLTTTTRAWSPLSAQCGTLFLHACVNGSQAQGRRTGKSTYFRHQEQ